MSTFLQIARPPANRRNAIIFNEKREITHKVCGSCRGEPKPIAEFNKRDLCSPYPSQRYQSRCRKCAYPRLGLKPPPEDLAGKKFHLLTIIRRVDGRLVMAKCDCGGEITASASNIKSGNTKSCGCLRKLTGGEQKFRVKPRYAWECG